MFFFYNLFQEGNRNSYALRYFKNDKFEGKGKFVYENGNFYQGEFKNDKFEGKGKHVYKNGEYYEG